MGPRLFHPLATIVGLLCGLLAARGAPAAPVTFSASGSTASSIQSTVDAFRTALGNPNNGNNPGPLASGRREINWDGAAGITNTVGTLTTFTNTRGATMTTPGTGFVQASPTDLATQLGNATYATTFAAFSSPRIFTPVGSNVTDITFSVPGSNGTQPASVSAFGAVFSDVDTNATSISLFDLANSPLGTFSAPSIAGASATFSFLGIFFNAGEQIGRVRITTGSTALGAGVNDGEFDAVAMDDFLYSEPIPEPGTLALCALGLGGLGVVGRRRTTTGLWHPGSSRPSPSH
ncbi:MAG TPA: PEP-CTERM sorting domain-containing protein [Myxococcota bacterium]|nr:PEP-CTERM sorting domain-containing protein [Myxococcota bacterium]